jgi:type IV pilus assembly protein PilO
MDLAELNNLDFTNIGSAPPVVKGFLAALVAAAVLAAGYFLDTEDQVIALDAATVKEADLKKTYEGLAAKAANLELYREQMKEMKAAFEVMLRQLPKKAEVEELLVDISQAGLAAGLEFELFKPGREEAAEFSNLPIEMKVTGKYHEFGEFVSSAAALPRIVTLHNAKVSGGGKNDTDLSMSLTARIYHYQEEEGQQ